MRVSVRTRVLGLVLVGGVVLLGASLALRDRELARQVGREAGERLGAALGRSARQLEAARVPDVSATEVAGLSNLRFAALIDAGNHVISAAPFDLAGTSADQLPLAIGVGRLDPAHADGRLLTRGSGLAVSGRVVHRTHEPPTIGPEVPPGPASDLVLLAELDDSPALKAGRETLVRQHGAALLVWGIVVLVLWRVLASGLSDPARRVAETLDRFATGDETARTGMADVDEIGAIGAAFDRLADRMRLEASDERDSHALLESTLESLPIGVLVARREDGRPVFTNSSWCRIYGRSPDPGRDILSHLGDVRCERADGSVYLVDELAVPTTLSTGDPARLEDVRLRREDGSVLSVAMTATPLRVHAVEGFDAVLATIEERPGAMAPGAARDEPAERPPERPRQPRNATVLVV